MSIRSVFCSSANVSAFCWSANSNMAGRGAQSYTDGNTSLTTINHPTLFFKAATARVASLVAGSGTYYRRIFQKPLTNDQFFLHDCLIYYFKTCNKTYMPTERCHSCLCTLSLAGNRYNSCKTWCIHCPENRIPLNSNCNALHLIKNRNCLELYKNAKIRGKFTFIGQASHWGAREIPMTYSILGIRRTPVPYPDVNIISIQ